MVRGIREWPKFLELAKGKRDHGEVWELWEARLDVEEGHGGLAGGEWFTAAGSSRFLAGGA